MRYYRNKEGRISGWLCHFQKEIVHEYIIYKYNRKIIKAAGILNFKKSDSLISRIYVEKKNAKII